MEYDNEEIPLSLTARVASHLLALAPTTPVKGLVIADNPAPPRARQPQMVTVDS